MKNKLLLVLVFLGIFNSSQAQSDGGKFSVGMGVGVNYFYPESKIDWDPGFVIPFPWGKLKYDWNNGYFVGIDVIYSVWRKRYDRNDGEGVSINPEVGDLYTDNRKYVYTNVNAYIGRYLIGNKEDDYNFYIRGGTGLFAFDQNSTIRYWYDSVIVGHVYGSALTFNVGIGLNKAIGTKTNFFMEYIETFGLKPFNNSPKFDLVPTSNRGINFGIRYTFN